jgi:menaquinone-dependent protoporphyrinogen oxidase
MQNMDSKVLVTYATKHGSTQEVAERIAGALQTTGLAVDLLPVRVVRSLTGYAGVALGAPLYMLRWHKEAHAFLVRFHTDLGALPVAVFALGPWEDKPEDWEEVRKELDGELAKHPWLTPVAKSIFGGKFDPMKLNFPWSWVPALKQMPPSDLRDWQAIGEWAQQLPGLFQGSVPVKETAQ